MQMANANSLPLAWCTIGITAVPASALPAAAADTTAPFIGQTALSPPPGGNGSRRRTAPVMLTLSAGDDVEVSNKFQGLIS